MKNLKKRKNLKLKNQKMKNLKMQHMKNQKEKKNQNVEEYPKEIEKAAPNAFCVPDTTIELTKESSEDDIRMAAVVAAFASQARDEIKNLIWGQIEPSIDEQLDKVENLPQKNKR